MLITQYYFCKICKWTFWRKILIQGHIYIVSTTCFCSCICILDVVGLSPSWRIPWKRSFWSSCYLYRQIKSWHCRNIFTMIIFCVYLLVCHCNIRFKDHIQSCYGATIWWCRIDRYCLWSICITQLSMYYCYIAYRTGRCSTPSSICWVQWIKRWLGYNRSCMVICCPCCQHNTIERYIRLLVLSCYLSWHYQIIR